MNGTYGPQGWGATSHSPDETHSRQPFQIAVTCAFLALTIPAVLLRVWVRKWMINSWGIDDWMMILSLFSFILYNVALMEIVASGGGTHITSWAQLRQAIDWLIVNEVFYLLTQIFLKLSLGYFFLRVVINKNIRRFIYGTIAFSTIVNCYHIFFTIFRCGNPGKYTEHQYSNRCVSNKVTVALSFEQAAISTFTDMVFAIMPIPLLWNATMDRRSKISAGCILSLGAFGSVCSIVRFLYVQNLGMTDDFFWSAVNLSIWSTIELGAGILAGSLATLRPLLKRLIRTTKHHMTHVTRPEKRSPTTKSFITKSSPVPANLESLPSVFRPWESINESGGYTTVCVGGSNYGKSGPNSQNKSIDILSTVDFDRTAIWPFVEDSAGIAKVVDVQVNISEPHSPANEIDIEKQHPLRSHKVVLEGGGLWGVRMEDKIRRPSASAQNTMHSRSSTPEWERLPDLLPMDEINRKQSEESEKTGKTSSTPGSSPSQPKRF